MDYLSWNKLFGYPTGKRNPRRTLKNAQWNTCVVDTYFEGQTYAAGSQYKYWEGNDFGYVVFHKDSKCPNGNIPARFIHRY